MNLDYSPDDEAFRLQVRAFLAPDERAHMSHYIAER